MTAPESPQSTHTESFEPVDLQTTPQSLSRAVLARRSEYVRPHKIRVKIGAWNVAACPGTDKDLARWFVDGEGIDKHFAALDLSRNPAVAHNLYSSNEDDPDSVRLLGGNDIGLYVLGLQEVVDLNTTKEYVNRAVKVDNSSTDKWQAALEAAMPPGYQLIVSEQMTGLLLLIYASPEIAPTVTNVSTKQVGTGLLGYFGNKGAVTSRLVLGETTRMVFVNCHLASGAGSNYLDRRCWDVDQILSKTKFDPVVHAGVSEDEGEVIGDEDFAFWFGDLNFRLDGLPGDDIRRILTLHTRGEYGSSSDKPPPPLEGEGVIVMRNSESDDDTTIKSSVHSRQQSFDSETTLPDPDDFPEDPSQDPMSLQATLDSLLPHDQLRRVIAQRKAFHDGWKEGHITFLPTYKYDVGTIGLFDSSEKQRSPSWCDRILYRTRKDKQDHDIRVREELESRKKDEEMKSRGIDQDDDVLFSYDPDTDGDDQLANVPTLDNDEYDETEDNKIEEVVTKEGFLDRISLDIYTSHQRISSSDHKPIISVFTLEYDAVVPDLKAKVHAEVARELDRAENEGRPAVTVVMEGSLADHESVLDVGDIGFLERKSCVVTVANTGSVSAKFSFVEKPTTDQEDSATLTWLTTSFIQPDNGPSTHVNKMVILEPGETVLAHIEAQVSTVSHLRALNDGHAKLEDVLVLRVEGGRDHFIPTKATWLPTCFGRSIDELIRVPDGGIRKFMSGKGAKGAIPYDSEVRCSAPKELFKLTEAIQTLAERCVADDAMLEEMILPQELGWPFDSATWTTGIEEQDSIKAGLVSALDNDASIFEALPVELSSVHKLELLSSILLMFLASLTDGLVPPLLWAKLSTALPNLTSLSPATWPDAKTQILDIFSSAPNHNIAFVFLTSTLSRVAAELSPTTAEPIMPGLSRRLSFRRGEDGGEKRMKMRQRRYAEIIGSLAFRTNDRDKAVKERERTVVEIFLGREAGS
ncbi:hypothetical protein QQS21_004840 [Conoideocrella luteorostrata]|uniref:Inositol polyphosphate-related phosphatase domain-containing protein n=1 Tax=Conoideocrella luteorostrata TaxID=1105319 RepID=A0AAJ0FZK3_9HYPO|nr:hypothetical protein QQS21_004840 [Conoideocrella luteorostrata]